MLFIATDRIQHTFFDPYLAPVRGLLGLYQPSLRAAHLSFPFFGFKAFCVSAGATCRISTASTHGCRDMTIEGHNERRGPAVAGRQKGPWSTVGQLCTGGNPGERVQGLKSCM